MNFKDKYQKPGDDDPKKITISLDAYAIGEMLSELNVLLEKLRQNG
jgi:hypothetical protein